MEPKQLDRLARLVGSGASRRSVLKSLAGGTLGAVAMLEINLGSGFRHELRPSVGRSRDPGPAVVDMLFPPGRPVRASVIAVAGDPETSKPVCETIARILTATGVSVGLATGAGLTVGGLTIRGDGVNALLNNPSTEIAVAAVDAIELIARGLGFTACDVAVVTSLSGIAIPFAQPVETVLANLVASDGALVLNADDPGVAALPRPEGVPIVLFSREPDASLVQDHLAKGGRAVVARSAGGGPVISLIAGGGTTDIVSTSADSPPLSILLPAAAAGVARNVAAATIRGALAR